MSNSPNVTAAVLVIGDEILSGRTQDTNLNAIARFVAAYGVDLAEARVIGDEAEEIVAALNALRARYDYVFTTGGIGPTHDDITADCVAAAFGLPLYEHPDILAGMKGRIDYELTPARRRMARVPQGASLIANAIKGPPGFQIGNVFVLAGVPAVMRGMLEDIGHRLKGGVVVTALTLRVDGFAEGMLAEPLGALAKANPDLSLGSYPFFGPDGYGANLVVRGRDPARVDQVLSELEVSLRAVGATQLSRVIG